MKAARGLLVLFSVEGLLAFLVTLFTPSESGRAVLLWLSRERLALLGLVLLVWGAFLAATLVLWRSTPRVERLLASLDDWCLSKGRLGAALVFFFVTPILLVTDAFAVVLTPLSYPTYQRWAPETFPLLHALVVGILPLLLLLLFIMLEVGVFLAVRYRAAALASQSWAWTRIGSCLILLLIGLVTLFHWIVLGFQLRFFANLPAWYWKVQLVPFSWRDLLFILAVIALLTLICWIVGRRRGLVPALILTFFLGCFLQIGVGFMAGGGFDSVAERYFTTYHRTYVQQASENNLSILDEIRQYETAFGAHSFTSTKPPGLMAFYIGLEQLVNGYPSAYSTDVRYARLSRAIEIAFPVLAAGLVFLVYAFARRFLDQASGWVSWVAPLLYVVCPNVALFSLFPDQAIYPLVFLLAVWFIVIAIQRQSLLWAFLIGLLLYLAVFFAFTMLPLYPFAGLYLLLNYLANRGHRPWTRPVLQALAIAAGTLLLYLLFLSLLNYDFLPRFEKTILINHNFDFYLRVGLKLPTAPESFSTRVSQTLNAAWFNNLDFAAAVGFPIYILFAGQGIRLLKRLFAGNAAAGDIILGSLFLSYIVLSLAGTAQGEVPRLWLFWLPMVVILASLEIKDWAEKQPLLLFGLVVAQFITIFLTFHFQDLRM
jgi:hypothetical protein